MGRGRIDTLLIPLETPGCQCVRLPARVNPAAHGLLTWWHAGMKGSRKSKQKSNDGSKAQALAEETEAPYQTDTQGPSSSEDLPRQAGTHGSVVKPESRSPAAPKDTLPPAAPFPPTDAEEDRTSPAETLNLAPGAQENSVGQTDQVNSVSQADPAQPLTGGITVGNFIIDAPFDCPACDFKSSVQADVDAHLATKVHHEALEALTHQMSASLDEGTERFLKALDKYKAPSRLASILSRVRESPGPASSWATSTPAQLSPGLSDAGFAVSQGSRTPTTQNRLVNSQSAPDNTPTDKVVAGLPGKQEPPKPSTTKSAARVSKPAAAGTFPPPSPTPPQQAGGPLTRSRNLGTPRRSYSVGEHGDEDLQEALLTKELEGLGSPPPPASKARGLQFPLGGELALSLPWFDYVCNITLSNMAETQQHLSGAGHHEAVRSFLNKHQTALSEREPESIKMLTATLLPAKDIKPKLNLAASLAASDRTDAGALENRAHTDQDVETMSTAELARRMIQFGGEKTLAGRARNDETEVFRVGHAETLRYEGRFDSMPCPGFCDLCHVELANTTVARMHCEGATHRKAMKTKGQEMLENARGTKREDRVSTFKEEPRKAGGKSGDRNSSRRTRGEEVEHVRAPCASMTCHGMIREAKRGQSGELGGKCPMCGLAQKVTAAVKQART